MSYRGYIQWSPFLEGDIPLEMALNAYQNSLFPMGDHRHATSYAWFSHVPRGIFPLESLHMSRSLQKLLRKKTFICTSDRAFDAVMNACAAPRKDEADTWICPPVQRLFQCFHDAGHAHSIEVWQDGALVGGLYGLHVGTAFFGESMFFRVPNAAKVALVALVGHLRQQGFTLLDIQQLNPLTEQMGGIEVDEETYMARLENAVSQDVQWGHLPLQPDHFDHPDLSFDLVDHAAIQDREA